MKEESMNNISLIAYCGLYCANCGKYKNGKCPGCAGNEKASWCTIRTCCIGRAIPNCSACEEYIDPLDCRKYNNFIARVIGFATSTDRSRCIEYLRHNSPQKFTLMMEERQTMSLPKGKRNVD